MRKIKSATQIAIQCVLIVELYLMMFIHPQLGGGECKYSVVFSFLLFSHPCLGCLLWQIL